MNIDVKLRGYRCFSPDSPGRIELRSDVAALVGVNNSGKSTLLRALYEIRPILSSLIREQAYLRAAVMQAAPLKLPPEVPDPEEIFWHFGSADLEIDVVLPERRDRPAGTSRNSNWRLTITINRESQTVSVTCFDLEGRPAPRGGGWHLNSFKDIAKPGFDLGSFGDMLSALEILERCFYYPSVRHAATFPHEEKSTTKYYDAFVGKAFVDEWARLQQSAGKIATQRIDTVVEDIRRIFRFERLSIQADGAHRELMLLANGKSLRLSEVGGGVAQFIFLLGNISLAKPSYLLLDEPENNLHPSLQLDFLNTVASHSSHGVLFATHSLGLARQAAARIFAFAMTSSGCSMAPFHQTENLSAIIGELSFGRSDFAPARKLLLVEGQTDVLTFQNFLSVFGKEHEFAIIQLGGRAGIHPRRQAELEQVLSLGIDVSVVIDSERPQRDAVVAKARADFSQMCGSLNIRCHILDRTAVENYFTQRSIDQAFGPGKFVALQEYQAPAAISWSKSHNWKIARASLKTEIEGTDLGAILKLL